MAATQQTPTVEDLPDDMLRDIISRAAQFSRRDVRNLMKSSKELARLAPQKQTYKSLTLKPLAKNPLWALNNYNQLMSRCLESENAEAHYIKGIHEYFYNNNTSIGLGHLKKAADGLYDDGIYLYGILMLCRGQKNTGTTYLERLHWRDDKARADRAWRHVKRSLQGLIIMRKRCYRRSLKKNEPPRECHSNDMDTRCIKCYYYKQMKKFVKVRTF